MTEEDWLAATDPNRMLALMRGKATDRKLRLFAVACCRRVGHLPADPAVRAALDAAERFADGGASDAERSAGRKAAQRAAEGRDVTRTPTSPRWQRRAASAVYWAAARNAGEAASRAPDLVVETLIWLAGGHHASDWGTVRAAERRVQASVLRDVFGNPFCPARVDPAWLTRTVVCLARGIDDDRAFDRLPILADAFQNAGCENEGLLGHCRGPGPHVRGCWVVDLLTGRE